MKLFLALILIFAFFLINVKRQRKASLKCCERILLIPKILDPNDYGLQNDGPIKTQYISFIQTLAVSAKPKCLIIFTKMKWFSAL